MALRIAHVSFSSTGGAGGVATRLAQAQQALGHEAFVVSHLSGSLRDAPWANPIHTLAAGADDALVRRRDFPASISLVRDGLSRNLTEKLAHADVVHVHWPNGFLDLNGLANSLPDMPVVWTLHDMNAFTGVCHYSLGCRSFESGCGGCPAVRKVFQPAVAKHFQKKGFALRQGHSWKFVSPSAWLASEAQKSALLQDRLVDVIANPLPPSLPAAIGRSEARARLGIHRDSTVFFVSASNLQDPVKNVGLALDAFHRAFPNGEGATLLVAGRQESSPAAPGVRGVGFLGAEELAHTLSAADYLVVTSHAENQPLSIAEAQAMGVSLIALSHTGLIEHADIDSQAILVETEEELSVVLGSAAHTSRSITSRSRAALARKARRKFDSGRIAQAYVDIYLSLV